MFEDSFVIASALLLARFVAVEASYQTARRTGKGFRFPVGIGMRIWGVEQGDYEDVAGRK